METRFEVTAITKTPDPRRYSASLQGDAADAFLLIDPGVVHAEGRYVLEVGDIVFIRVEKLETSVTLTSDV